MKKMNPIISVVLPVYNVKNYIEKCVESVCNQTYRELEIILVDDGSTDGSGVLCDQLQKTDSRIKVIHKKNGGLSDARNAGTLQASGEYITYIDSDDYVKPTYVEYLYELIKKYNCKMSLCTHIVSDESGKYYDSGDGTDELLSAESCLERMLYHDVIDTSAWAKLYHMDLAKKILYPKGKLFEDIGTTYRFFIESGEIACGYKSQYYYMVRSNSIVTGSFNMQKLDLLEMTDMMAEEVGALYPNLAAALMRRRVYARFSTLNQMRNVSDHVEIRNELIRFIKEHRKEVMNNPKTPKRDKIAIILLNMGYPVYKFCWGIKAKI